MRKLQQSCYDLTLSCPEGSKPPGVFSDTPLAKKNNSQKIFVGEMLIKTQDTTLLQIFCEFVINFKVFFISIRGPDKTFQEDLQA